MGITESKTNANKIMPIEEILVSVIIPAHNSGDTLEKTLDSLLSQNYKNWEAIIVDNFSNENTFLVARNYSQKDSRFRVTIENNLGVSQARNTGIQVAYGNWLLFLDSDDWLLPEAITSLVEPISENQSIDAVYCDAVRVAADGTELRLNYSQTNGDLFSLFANRCGFPIHCCLVKKNLAQAVGGFDVQMKYGEDWDFWQKISRTGAYFYKINKILSMYRLRKNSTILKPDTFYQQHEILIRATEPDYRLVDLKLKHQEGISKEGLEHRVLELLAYCSAFLIGQKLDPRPLIKELKDYHFSTVNLNSIVVAFYDLIPCAKQQSPKVWPEIYQEVLPLIDIFLTELEGFIKINNLKKDTIDILNTHIANRIEKDVVLSDFFVSNINLSEQIQDIKTISHIKKVHLNLFYYGDKLPDFELPLVNGILAGGVVRDKVARKFYWQILEKYFSKEIYPNLVKKQFGDNVSFIHNEQEVIQVLARDLEHIENDKHNFVWWNVLLSKFNLLAEEYSAEKDQVQWVENSVFEIELGSKICSFSSDHQKLIIRINFKNQFLGQIQVELNQRYVHSNIVKNLVIEKCKDILPILYVRDFILKTDDSCAVVIGANATLCIEQEMLSDFIDLDILNSAKILDQQIVFNYQAKNNFVVFDPSVEKLALNRNKQRNGNTKKNISRKYDRQHFEAFYASKENPWSYDSEYEKNKYQQTLSILPEIKFENVLELACAEGHFTEMLADKVEKLVSADISDIALHRAFKRCERFGDKIDFKQVDFVKDDLGFELYDLVICSEALYSCCNINVLNDVVSKIAKSLKHGGYFLTTNSNVFYEEENSPGFDWHDSFGSSSINNAIVDNEKFYLVKQLSSPYYRINLFQIRESEVDAVYETVKCKSNEEIEKQFVWNVNKAKEVIVEDEVLYESIPILLYHRIGESKIGLTNEYCVSETSFYEQVKYLSDSGYSSLDLEEFSSIVRENKKLKNKHVILTFDDGFEDFYSIAWPILKKFNLNAIVFLVTKSVGLVNIWDIQYQEPVSLMSWDHILKLREEGVIFGSHTRSHLDLSNAPNSRIISEIFNSRADIEAKINFTVDAFAYPYGHYNEFAENTLKISGYKFGFSCENRPANIYENNLYNLPRIEIHRKDNFYDFVKKLGHV